MPQTLRPREFGELIGQTFSVFFTCLARILSVQAFFWLPFIAAGAVLLVALAMSGGFHELTRGRPEAATALLMGASGFLFLVFFLVLSPIPGAACLLVVSDEFTGKSTPLSTAFRAAFQRLFALLTLGLAVTLLIAMPLIPGMVAMMAGVAFRGPESMLFLGTGVLFLLGGMPFAMYFFTCYTVASPSLVVEGLSVGAAMKKSKELTHGFRLKALGLTIIISILTGVVAQTVEMVAWVSGQLFLRSEYATFLGKTLSTVFNNVVGGGIGGVLTVVLYFDLRVRKEAFDLESIAELVDVIAERAGLPPAPPAQAPDAAVPAPPIDALSPPAGDDSSPAPPHLP